jgi:hypothetical protein
MKRKTNPTRRKTITVITPAGKKYMRERKHPLLTTTHGYLFLFTAQQVSDLCGVKGTHLRQMVGHGTITPIVRGKTGDGNQARFSPQQTLGCAIACGLIFSKRGCGREYAKETIDTYARMPNEVLQDLVTGACLDGASPYAQETAAAWRLSEPWFNRTIHLPDDPEQQDQVWSRFRRVIMELRRHLGIDTGDPATSFRADIDENTARDRREIGDER